MSLKALIVALALGVLTWPSTSHAEKATTNQITKVFSRAGEQSPVILKVKAGQQMTILAKDGRWIKVRVSGRTGWVPRSKVDLPDEEIEMARNTRRRPFVDGRSTTRGFGGEVGPDDRVGADAIGEGAEPADGEKPDKVAKAGKPADGEKPGSDDDGKSGADDDDSNGAERPVARVTKTTVAFAEPNAKSEAAFTAKPAKPLYILKEKGKWTFIENDEGDKGYVATTSLTMGAPDEDEMVDGERRRRLAISAGVGGSFISQKLASTGGAASPPDNYNAQSASVSAALGASAMFPVGSRYWFGADVDYDFHKAVPGVGYMGERTSFTYQILNARLALGLQMQSGTVVLARVGVHYDAFQVPNFDDLTKNTLALPNQNILGPTIGAALVIPRLTRKLSFTASVDAIVAAAQVSQTKNLEDGTDPDAKAVYVGLAFGYHMSPQMALQMTYDFGYTAVSFGGPPPATSLRKHTGTGISGTDLNNILSFGVLYGF